MRMLVLMVGNILLELSNHRKLTLIAGIVAWLASNLFGAFAPSLLSAVVILLLGDWLLGTLRALIARQAARDPALQGLVKLIVYLALMAMTTLLVQAEMGELGAGTWHAMMQVLVGFIGAALIVTEAISVLQHLRWFADRAGVRVPILDLVLNRLQREADHLNQGPQA